MTVRGLAQWRRTMSDVFPHLTFTSTDIPEFDAQMSRREVGGIWMSNVTTSAHRVERLHPTEVPGDPFYSIQLQLTGTSTVTQDGRTATLGPGDFVALDSATPCVCDFPTRCSVFVARFPHQLIALPPRLWGSLAAHRMPGDSGLSALASALMAAMSRNLDVLADSTMGVSAANSLRELIMAALGEGLGLTESPANARRLEESFRVREWITERLGDPTLAPEQIAAAHFISVRKLQGMFSEQGTTVTDWIRDRRLDMARRDLIAPLRRDEPVARIAARWGFVDPSYFARAFRTAYGVTPRRYRAESAERARLVADASDEASVGR